MRGSKLAQVIIPRPEKMAKLEAWITTPAQCLSSCNWNSRSIDAIIDVCAVHPAFQPCEYHAVDIKKTSENSASIQLLNCLALQEKDEYAFGWFAMLARGKTAGLEAIMKGIDPRARLAVRADEVITWDIIIDDALTEMPDPLAVQIAKGTVLYQTKLDDHIQLLQM
jgi:hypothetical protein